MKLNEDYSMTLAETLKHQDIVNLLNDGGFGTAAAIIDELCDIALVPRTSKSIAWMEPSNATIYINEGIANKYLSAVVRHELAHHIMMHEIRLLKHLAEKHDMDFDKLLQRDDLIDDIEAAARNNDWEKLNRELYKDKIFNKAADFEISNFAYTDEDKELLRNFVLNGKQLRLLITEDIHKDWPLDASLEDMYDWLQEERNKDPKPPKPPKPPKGSKPKIVYGKLINKNTFHDTKNSKYYGG